MAKLWLQTGASGRVKVVVALLTVLLVLQWWNARTDVSNLRRELAQRLQSGDNINSQTKLIASRVDDEVRTLQGKVALLEARQLESQGQQLALEQLYQDLAKIVTIGRWLKSSRYCPPPVSNSS